MYSTAGADFDGNDRFRSPLKKKKKTLSQLTIDQQQLISAQKNLLPQLKFINLDKLDLRSKLQNQLQANASETADPHATSKKNTFRRTEMKKNEVMGIKYNNTIVVRNEQFKDS